MSVPLHKGRWLSLVLVIVTATLSIPDSVGAPKVSRHAVMAQMITRFLTYSKWPAGARAQARKEVTVTVFTNDKAVVQQFKGQLHDKVIRGIKWKVSQVRTEKAAMDYAIVFFELGVPEPSDAWYGKVADRGILTFGEMDEKGARNAALNFEVVERGGKPSVKFDVDLGVAAKAGVKFAPQLGRVARKVIRAK
jgi:hypothetical protein